MLVKDLEQPRHKGLRRPIRYLQNLQTPYKSDTLAK